MEEIKIALQLEKDGYKHYKKRLNPAKMNMEKKCSKSLRKMK